MNINLEFANPVEWNIENDYAVNDVVFYGTEAFTAIDYVPSGTLLTNANYWKKTGKYIGTSDIADDSITTQKLADGSVTMQKLADGAITKEILPDVISNSANGETITATDASYLATITIDGKAVQDGTPSPSNPVEIQVVQAPDDGTFGISINETVTPIDLQGNVVASLPDGTKSVLHVDSVGHVVLEKRANHKVFDGSESWTAYTFAHGSGFYSTGISDMIGAAAAMVDKAICSAFTIKSSNNTTYDGDMYFDNSKSPCCINSNCTTVEEFKAWLAANPVDLYYACELETIDLGYIDMPEIPDGSEITITAQVTPTIAASWWVERASSIPEALKSMRNDLISKFDGEFTTLASSLAPIETNIASANYAIGSYLVVDNVLYKVISAIASGESIIPGTNVTATTVMAEILALTS